MGKPDKDAITGYTEKPDIKPTRVAISDLISRNFEEPAKVITKNDVMAAATPKSCDCHETNPAKTPNKPSVT